MLGRIYVVIGLITALVVVSIALDSTHVGSATVELRVDVREFEIVPSAVVPVDAFSAIAVQFNDVCSARFRGRGGADNSDSPFLVHAWAADDNTSRIHNLRFEVPNDASAQVPNLQLRATQFPSASTVVFSAPVDGTGFTMRVETAQDDEVNCADLAATPPVRWQARAARGVVVEGLPGSEPPLRSVDVESTTATIGSSASTAVDVQLDDLEGEPLLIENSPLASLDLRWFRRGPDGRFAPVSSIVRGQFYVRNYGRAPISFLSGEEIDLKIRTGMLRSVRLLANGIFRLEFTGVVESASRRASPFALASSRTRPESLLPTKLDHVRQNAAISILSAILLGAAGAVVSWALVHPRKAEHT